MPPRARPRRRGSSAQARSLSPRRCGERALSRARARRGSPALSLAQTPEEAYRPFRGVYPPFPPFHDASPCACTFDLTVLDCLRGLAKAMKFNFFDSENFDVEEYEHFEQVENGDLNWIVYGKFLAFAGPHDTRTITPDGYPTLTPADYIPYFKKKGLSLVVSWPEWSRERAKRARANPMAL